MHRLKIRKKYMYMYVNFFKFSDMYVNFFKFSDINGKTYTNLTLGLSQSLQNTFLKLASD